MSKDMGQQLMQQLYGGLLALGSHGSLGEVCGGAGTRAAAGVPGQRQRQQGQAGGRHEGRVVINYKYLNSVTNSVES